MTIDDVFAPLREEQPTDAEIARVLAAADRAAPRGATARRLRRRRTGTAALLPARRRLAPALALATAAVAALVALAPGSGTPSGPAALLRAAAASAAEQPPFTGYRYTQTVDTYNGRTEHLENWVDRDWQGETIRDGKSGPFLYGDGPLAKVPLAELPTEPQALLDTLTAAYKDLRWAPQPGSWAPGRPTEGQTRYDITREILLLLGTANTTPELRSALWGALALMPGLQEAQSDKGAAVTLPAPSSRPVPAGTGAAGDGTFTVVFDVQTAEMLSWSETGSGAGTPDQTHVFVRAGHVSGLDERPGN